MLRDLLPSRDVAAAVVVAHPDDETIWCGGLILEHPDWDWTIVSLCRAGDEDRRPKFHAACDRLNADRAIFNLDDSSPLEPIHNRQDIGRPVLDAIGERPWDLILTHGQNGEYGHRRHIEVHAEVLALVAEGLLECQQLWCFACHADATRKTCRAEEDADACVELGPDMLAEKRRIITDVYGFDKTSFEARACVSPEGFRRIPLPTQE